MCSLGLSEEVYSLILPIEDKWKVVGVSSKKKKTLTVDRSNCQKKKKKSNDRQTDCWIYIYEMCLVNLGSESVNMCFLFV